MSLTRQSPSQVERICENCKVTFFIHRHRLTDESKGRFCSVECRRKSRQTKFVKPCERCGTPFETVPSVVASPESLESYRAKRARPVSPAPHKKVGRPAGVPLSREALDSFRQSVTSSETNCEKLLSSVRQKPRHNASLSGSQGRPASADQTPTRVPPAYR